MLDREKMMPYVGKAVSIQHRSGQGLVGILAMHKFRSEVCLGMNDAVIPPYIYPWNGVVRIDDIDSVRELGTDDFDDINNTLRGAGEQEWTGAARWKFLRDEDGNQLNFRTAEWIFKPEEIKKASMWNTVCPKCGSEAYQSLMNFECSRGCKVWG